MTDPGDPGHLYVTVEREPWRITATGGHSQLVSLVCATLT